MFQVGQSLGDYAVLQELGKGGYGQIYKVEHTITGRREAMKVLASTHANAAEQSERFLREIRLQASLNHPNIAVVHTAFWVNDDLALVCELLEGESLRQLLERQPASLPQALDIMRQVLDAMSYAHARGIIHRDISPANIFVTAGGTVKIIDFGLAKAATDLRLTREGSPVGAAHYMSPEQIRGAQDIDARTDIYSCGVVLYEIVVGKKPFDGDSAFDIMKAHTEDTPPSPAQSNPQVPAALSDILLRALAKKPDARFQSADAFLQAINEIQVEPVRASNRKALRRPVLIAACVIVAILVGALVSAVTARRGNAQSETGRSFAVPPPPAIVTRGPIAAPTENVPPVKTAAPTSPKRAKLSPAAARTASADAATEEPDNGAAGSAHPEAKTRNPVVKLGGFLKRINPLHQNNSASRKDGQKH